jgi:ABC-2 type transport system ATP-binding protein
VTAEPAIAVEDLVKVFAARAGQSAAARPAVDGLSFAVRRGSIFGLLGPNGAGKTTTLRILTTLVRPSAGSARVLGFDVVRQAREVRRNISVVIQENAAELFLSVRENLITFARFHGLRGAEVRRRAERVIEELGLGAEAGRKVQDLSGGFRRRVQVAKIFMVETPIVFLDEFSTGMDPLLKRAVMELLRQAAARGRTIVLTTQVLVEAEELCDDILIIDRGRALARGDLSALKLLSERVHEVTLSFERLSAEQGRELQAALAPFRPLRVALGEGALRFALRDEAARVLEVIAALAARAPVLRMEVHGASLEDIFIELTRKGATA